MDSNHPLRWGVLLLRCWLGMVVLIMTINANTAAAYVMSDTVKSVPFYTMALVALFWASKVWDSILVIVCCTLLTVGTSLRGLEVLFYAEAFPIQQRITGVTLWWFISGTSLFFGALNLIATSRREIEGVLYGESSTSSDGA